MNKKVLSMLLALCVSFSFGACTNKDTATESNTDSAEEAASEEKADNSEPAEPAETEEYQYMDKEELKHIITSMQPDYLIIDCRKKADYDESHIITSVSADVDSAVNGDDTEAAGNLDAATKGVSDGTKYVLLCYTGNKYAQNATRLLKDKGVAASDIFTLEGGYKEWTNNDTNGAYQYLIDVAVTAEDNKFTPKQFAVPRTGDSYLSADEVKALLESREIEDYYVIDTRTAEEYETGHLVTARNAADFASSDQNLFEPRDVIVKNVDELFKKDPYQDGQKLILVCRGGKGGAQLMDDVLVEKFDINNDLIYTLSSGFVAFDDSWTKLGDEYMKYVVTGAELGEIPQ